MVSSTLFLNFIVAMALTCLGIAALVVYWQKLDAYPNLKKTRSAVFYLGLCIGFLMTWVSWPVRHQLAPLADGSFREVNLAGIPAPMAYIMHFDARLGMPSGVIHTMLGLLAFPINMAFWCGVGQLGLYVYARRRK